MKGQEGSGPRPKSDIHGSTFWHPAATGTRIQHNIVQYGLVRGQYTCVAELAYCRWAYIEHAVPEPKKPLKCRGTRTSHVDTRTKLSRQKQASLAWILWILAFPSSFWGDDGCRVAQRNNLQADHTAAA